MTVIVFIVLLGALFTSVYYGRKVDLKRIEQIELQNKQQSKMVDKMMKEIGRGVIVFHKGKFIVYKGDTEEEA